MPLRKSPSHSDALNYNNGAQGPSVSPSVTAGNLVSDTADDLQVDSPNGSISANPPQSRIEAMKTRSRSTSSSPRELVKLRTFRLDTLSESPKITFDDVEPRLNMGQLSPPDDTVQAESTLNGTAFQRSSPVHPPRSGTLSPDEGLPSETAPWSSAIGHASTGKSGRVIERLQAEIDRLNRDKHLVKVKMEEAEKTKEAAQAQITFLQDRNSNLEQSHEANTRQLNRKDRMIDELRTDLKKEKLKTSNAENTAKGAIQGEEQARTAAKRAEALAVQRDHEYETIKNARNLDKNQYQTQLDKLRRDFSKLLEDRRDDDQTLKCLNIIAEQQKHAINKLQEDNRKTDRKFQEYRYQVDTLFAELSAKCGANDQQIVAALEESQTVLGQMKWVMNVQRDVPEVSLATVAAIVQEE